MGMISYSEMQDKIATIRKQHVMADADVAQLHGEEIREVNQAVRNNSDRFPNGYMVELSKSKLQDFQSKISTTNFVTNYKTTDYYISIDIPFRDHKL